MELLSDLVKQIGSSVSENIVNCLESRGLGGPGQREPTVNVDSPRVADLSRVNLVVKPDVNSMDCGKAKGFVHCIHLSDTKPFRLPYRRLSPSHYEKLREALDEMEEREIIRKSTSYYNVEVHEQDKKLTAFTSPFGLYEYNRLPQGLCNSLATFMRMMMSIFGDQNFLSLLCYLDDVLVSAPDEQLALQRLGMVFERLTT
ncbi:hypothetical protein AAFF_G00018450 [Aldrovandia affinis]|uniref:ribonuclease H n=1 Tax=Aldrovandia affinis TaxID=143900 RepID=A0AAD7VXH0_9TELE|nr:hypothetical protein AAFF_G00018450 [Aldrovandia affinis]